MASLGTNVLHIGDTINQGDWIESPNGLFRAGMTVKGYFVLYAFNTEEMVMKVNWRMDTAEPEPNSYLFLHAKGRIEIHGPGGDVKSFRGCQSVSTQEVCKFGSDYYLILQDDGNLVLNGLVQGTPLEVWSSDSAVSNTSQAKLTIPGVLVITLDQSSLGGSTFDKNCLNNTDDRVIVRAGSSQFTLPQNSQCGVVSMAGTVNVSSVSYDYDKSMPDEQTGVVHGNSNSGPSQTYGPQMQTIKIGMAANGAGFTLT